MTTGSPAIATLPPGTPVDDGRYEVVEHVHRSARADVYAALDTSSRAPIALKLVRPERVTERCRVERMARESALLVGLAHPNIVRGLGATITPPGLAMEHLPGRTLRAELKALRRLPVAQLSSLATQLAGALAHMHATGLLHCDVKPANIMATGARYVLIDIELARAPCAVRGGLGTRLFSSPEQAGGGDVTAATDVWGLGVVLYRATTGHLPFHGEEGYPQLNADAAPAASHPRATVGPEACALLDAMLARDPTQRPTLDDVSAAFANFT